MMWRLIRVSILCYQGFLSQIEQKRQKDQKPLKRQMDSSNMQQWKSLLLYNGLRGTVGIKVYTERLIFLESRNTWMDGWMDGIEFNFSLNSISFVLNQVKLDGCLQWNSAHGIKKYVAVWTALPGSTHQSSKTFC